MEAWRPHRMGRYRTALLRRGLPRLSPDGAAGGLPLGAPDGRPLPAGERGDRVDRGSAGLLIAARRPRITGTTLEGPAMRGLLFWRDPVGSVAPGQAHSAAAGNTGNFATSCSSCWMTNVASRLRASLLKRSIEANDCARSVLNDGTPADTRFSRRCTTSP